jgi:hypothetical protein
LALVALAVTIETLLLLVGMVQTLYLARLHLLAVAAALVRLLADLNLLQLAVPVAAEALMAPGLLATLLQHLHRKETTAAQALLIQA